MLEWYRTEEDYEVVVADALSLICLAAETAGERTLSWRGRMVDPFADLSE